MSTSVPDDRDREALATALHEHLAATAELPLDPTANRWLGEAAALAADLAENQPPPTVVRDRASQVVRLLESAGDTGHPEGEEHAAAALELARELAAADDGTE